MLVLSSPSGAGKTSIARELLTIDNNLQMSVSATTRPRRPGEVHGIDYEFVEPNKLRAMIEGKKLLEYAKVFDYYIIVLWIMTYFIHCFGHSIGND